MRAPKTPVATRHAELAKRGAEALVEELDRPGFQAALKRVLCRPDRVAGLFSQKPDVALVVPAKLPR